MCPTLRRTAGPARSHCLRSARTRRVGRARRDAGRCGAAQGCTQAVSASTTRATCPARSRQCALRSGAQQGPLDLTTCDQRGRDASAGRCGAVWDCRNGSSRAAEAPPPRARTSCPGCSCASSCCTTHGPEARACWGRRATGGTPTVRGARSTSRRDRCVTHWRSDGTTPPGAGAPARERVLLGCSKGEINGKVGRGHESAPSQATTRKPSTCGCSPRVRSGLLPREDHASNLVGPVRGRIGLLGRRRPFRAVRHFRRKWATRTPSTLRRG